jgi:hypothetical protein
MNLKPLTLEPYTLNHKLQTLYPETLTSKTQTPYPLPLSLNKSDIIRWYGSVIR